MKKNDSFSSLNDTVFIVQLEEFCDRFNKDMAERERSVRKKFFKALIPFGIGGIASLVTFNPLFFCIGVAGFGACAIVKVIQDGREEDRRIQESDERLLRQLKRSREQRDGEQEPEKVIYMDEEPDLESQVWGVTPIIASKASDFYTDRFKDFVLESETEEQIEAPESQFPKLEIVRPEKPLNKDETQNKIVHEYEMYCIAYKIPDMKIKPREWDILFDTVYERLEELNITEQFYTFMNFLLKYVLSTSLIHSKRTITIYSFVEKIPKLEIIGFDSREAQSLAKEVDAKLTPDSNKIVDLKILDHKK